MIKRINSGLNFKKVLFIVLLFIFGATSFAQTSVTSTIPEAAKKKNVLESYFENTIFKIKDEKGNISAEKRFNDLSLAKKKRFQTSFLMKEDYCRKKRLSTNLKKEVPKL